MVSVRPRLGLAYHVIMTRRHEEQLDLFAAEGRGASDLDEQKALVLVEQSAISDCNAPGACEESLDVG